MLVPLASSLAPKKPLHYGLKCLGFVVFLVHHFDVMNYITVSKIIFPTEL
jgi:hypothetical protein